MARPAEVILPFLLLLLAAATGLGSAGIASERENAPQGMKWRRASVALSVSPSLFNSDAAIKPGSDVRGAIERAASTWEEATGVAIRVVYPDKQTTGRAGPGADGVNLLTIGSSPENLQLFGGDPDEAARTRVFFTRTGSIVEADVFLNPLVQFSTDGSVGTFDLESTLTHEIGHLLGLEHSPVIAATMYPLQARNGTNNIPAVTQRTLADDDLTQVRARYPRTGPDCCGAVTAAVTGLAGEAAPESAAWLEDPETGRVVAGRYVGDNFSVSFRGLRPGSYRLYFQVSIRDGEWLLTDLGTVSVGRGRAVRTERRDDSRTPAVRAGLGLGGQLGRFPIPIDRGSVLDVWFGGEWKGTGSRKVWFAGIPVLAQTSGIYDYGDGLRAEPFRLAIPAGLGDGDYSVRVSDGPTDGFVLIGALTADLFSNPWSTVDLNPPD